MRVLVCGGRNFADYKLLTSTLDQLHGQQAKITSIIHGGAKGADTLAGEWADSRQVQCKVYDAQWNTFGRAAGPIRNQKMLSIQNPNIVVAFAGGNGTWDMIKRSRKTSAQVIIV